MLADEPAGVGVVRRDARRATEHLCPAAVVLGRRPEPGALQAPQSLADALGQLRGRLAREGQPQHLVGSDQTVGDEPDDPCGHRLGLAGSGARDDEQGPGPGLDDRGLLVGRSRQVQRTCDLEGGEAHPLGSLRHPLRRRGHRASPSGWTGQDDLTGHVRHCPATQRSWRRSCPRRSPPRAPGPSPVLRSRRARPGSAPRGAARTGPPCRCRRARPQRCRCPAMGSRRPRRRPGRRRAGRAARARPSSACSCPS